jgi:predicted RNA methylase
MALQKDPEGIERKTLHKLVDFTNKTVLEIGCGEGRLTWKYAASAKRVVGFDPDHDSLRVARADAATHLASQDIMPTVTNCAYPLLKKRNL